MTQTIGVSLEYLKELAALARRNHTEQAFLILAMDWAEKANAEIDKLQKDLERERMRLVACEVVALGNTPESAAKAREMRQEFCSTACDAVASAVDREMRYRESLEKIIEAHARLCEQEFDE